MMIRTLLRRFLVMNALDEGGGGGAIAEPTPQADVQPDTPAGQTDLPGVEKAPETMLEAMERHFNRDEQGRFAPRADEAVPAAAAKPGQPAAAVPGTAPAAPAPAAPTVKPGEEDLVMPQGLAPASQQRFQALANEVRELRPLREQVDTQTRQLSYVKETFESHGIQQPQFEQAAAVIGMINRGDFAGAEKVLLDQLQQIALMTGRQPGQVDALANFPDLRQAVDNLQVAEPHALEIARARHQALQGQQVQQRQQQEQQATQQEQQAFQQGQRAVDGFCQQMKRTDVDYAQIEAQLLPHIPKMLAGVPPAQWAGIVQAQYQMIKQVAAQARQSAGGTSFQSIRPTGAASPSNAPKTAYEAMFGTPDPRPQRA